MAPHAAPAARDQLHLAGTCILTLDDQASMRSVIRSVLLQCGCRDILQAGSGSEALRLFATRPIDLIICDWMMAPMNGFEFLTELRKSDNGAKVPVIMLTANSEPDDAMAAQHLNIGAWLVKPIAPKRLVERISSVLSLPTQLFSVADDLAIDLSYLAPQYRLKLVTEVNDLKQLVETLPQQDTAQVMQHCSSMVRLLHTVKGQAGTFDHDLITTLAGIGQNLLREAEGDAAVLMKFQGQLQRALSVLVSAMSIVLQSDLKGDGGSVGGKLLGKINQITLPLRQMMEAERKNGKKS